MHACVCMSVCRGTCATACVWKAEDNLRFQSRVHLVYDKVRGLVLHVPASFQGHSVPTSLESAGIAGRDTESSFTWILGVQMQVFVLA